MQAVVNTTSTEQSQQPINSPRWNNSIDGRILTALCLLSCCMFLPLLGTPGIVNSSDGYYSEAAREMIERRDILTPYLNYAPFYDKPILSYWLIIFSYKLFGVSMLAARIPSALCAIASIPMLYGLTRRFLSRRAALLSALALLSMPLFVVIGRVALTDMPLMFLTTTANLLLLSVLNGAGTALLWPAYVALGLAFLCKGPIGLVVTAVSTGGYLVLTSRSFADFFERLQKLNPLIGCLILTAVALPWFVMEHFATRGEFTRYFFIEQNLGRASGKFGSHLYQWWFYIPFYFGGFFPWTTLLLQAPFIFRLRKKRFLENRKAQLLIAASCWTIGTLALFSLAASKLPTYLLPVAPALAILTGCYLDIIIRVGRRRPILWTAPAMIVGFIIAFFVVPRLIKDAYALKPVVLICMSALSLGVVTYCGFLLKSRIRAAIIVLTASCCLASGILVPIGLLIVYRHNLAAQHRLLVQTASLHDSNLAILGKGHRSSAFYSRQKIYELDTIDEFSLFMQNTKGPHYFVLPSKRLNELLRWLHQSARVINQKGDWYLVRSDDGVQLP